MSWSFEKEAEELYYKLLESDEDISIDEFYQKYASKQFLEASEKEHQRKKELRKRGIYE